MAHEPKKIHKRVFYLNPCLIQKMIFAKQKIIIKNPRLDLLFYFSYISYKIILPGKKISSKNTLFWVCFFCLSRRNVEFKMSYKLLSIKTSYSKSVNGFWKIGVASALLVLSCVVLPHYHIRYILRYSHIQIYRCIEKILIDGNTQTHYLILCNRSVNKR